MKFDGFGEDVWVEGLMFADMFRSKVRYAMRASASARDLVEAIFEQRWWRVDASFDKSSKTEYISNKHLALGEFTAAFHIQT